MSSFDSFLNILFVVLTGWLCAYIASKKGRSAIVWFLLGTFFTIFAVLILIFLPPIKPTKKRQQGKEDSQFSGTTIDVKPISREDGSEELLQNPEAKEWFYLDETRQQAGPITVEEVRRKYREGTINDSSYLWCEGMKEWKKLSDLNIK